MQKVINYCDKCGKATDKTAQIRIDFHWLVKIPPMAYSQANWQSTCNGAEWLEADICPECAAEIANMFFSEAGTVTAKTKK